MGRKRVDEADFIASLKSALPGDGDERICIAVLDGPIERSHPSFQGARLRFLDTPGEAAGGRALFHGTHVASVIFGQAHGPVRGIAPGCRGLIVPIFADRGASLTCSQLDLARAILRAVEEGAHIINISGGQLKPSGEADPILAQAIETCARRNVLIVAAAGNDGCDCLHIPAATPTVLAVGAMDRDGEPLASSNWGGVYGSQGILAPGVEVPGAAVGGGIALKSGTSFASPFISGLAGLLAGLQLAQGKTPDPHAIRAALLKTAFPCHADGSRDCRKFLSGRVNIAGTVREIIEGNAMTTDTPLLPQPAALLGAHTGTGFQPSDITLSAAEDETPVRASAAATTAVSQAPGQISASDCGCGCGGHGKKEGGEHKCSCGGKGPGEDGHKCDCGCGGEAKKPQLVYALGKLGYDFGSEARRDSLVQAMDSDANNPLLPDQWLRYLNANPFDASSVIWTLNLDATPIYAIQPVGAFAASGYERLREALNAQLNEGVELISVPGVIGGSVRLQSGQVVPVIVPAIRGMYSWATRPLVEHVLGAVPTAAAERDTYERFSAGLTNFLDRVYYDLRNLGITGEERALNYSATNAVQIADVIRSSTQDQLDLDSLAVKKSPVCRPDSECYDVELSFFNPANTNTANRVYRFTVDVSDVIPVTVGTVRSWTRRA